MGILLTDPAPAGAAGSADAVLAEVSAAVAQGQYQHALNLAGAGLGEAGIGDVTRARLLAARGTARQALGANEEALADFTQALSVGALPLAEQARALFARGVSLDSLGRLQAALGDYNGVLKLAPDASYALNNRANVLRRQNRFEEARRDYLAALGRYNPNPQYPYYGLGQIAEAEGDVLGARSFYSKALFVDPGFRLAQERLLALGVVADRATGLPADTGVIVLRPPSARVPAAVPAATVAAAARARPVTPPQSGRPPPPGRGAPLRPAILESGGAMVQLGAWRSAEEALAGWSVAQEGAEGLLDGLEPLIQRADIAGRGTYYRLRLRSPQPPIRFCAALAPKGIPCVPAPR